MYILKKLKEKMLSSIDEENYFNEEIRIKFLSTFPENKYTPKLYDSQEYPELNKNQVKKTKEDVKSYYVIDFITNGCLLYYTSPYCLLEKRIAKLLFKKILEAVKFLHSKYICHLDLKPENILLDKNFEPIIIDFGSIGKYSETEKIIKDIKKREKTKQYAAPEMNYNEIDDGEKADIYSLGAILFKLFTGGYVAGKSNDKKLYELIWNKKYKDYREEIKEYNDKYNLNYFDEFKELYFSMLAHEPDERPTIEKILESDWMKEVSDLDKEEKKAEKEKLENEYRNEFSRVLGEIRNFYPDLKGSKKIVEEGYITRSKKDEEYTLFKKEDTKKNI